MTKPLNPLNVLEMRRVEYCPPYFHTITLNATYNMISSINTWIYNNTKGRYYINKTVTLNSSNTFFEKLKVGFENPNELTYFTLACPHLKYYN